MLGAKPHKRHTLVSVAFTRKILSNYDGVMYWWSNILMTGSLFIWIFFYSSKLGITTTVAESIPTEMVKDNLKSLHCQSGSSPSTECW